MTGRPRLTSLDTFRGLVVALLVLVEWVLPSPAYPWLRHSPWDGLRVADVVFPAFLFMVGAGASFATPGDGRRLAKRTVLLLVLGLLFNAWGTGGADLSMLRLPGVLQMIAVAGLLTGLVTRFVQRPAVVAGLGLGLAAVHGLVISHVRIDCGAGRLDPGCSVGWAVDRHVFGLDHLYRQGVADHDPEGLLTTAFGATALVLLGWAAGRFLYRQSSRAAAGALAAACLAGAGLASLFWPLNKRVWTPTFSLLLAGGCILVLVALAALLDGREHRHRQPVRWTLTALGRNALLLYVGQHVVLTALLATPAGDGTLATALLDQVGSLLGVAVLAVAVWSLVAAALHALDWHWTA